MGRDRTTIAEKATTQTIYRTKTTVQQARAERHSVCSKVRYPLGNAAQGNGLRLRHDLLAATEAVATLWCVAATARSAACETARSRPIGFLTRGGGQFLDSRRGRGEKTGPNPTDRRRPGSKHHIVTDAQGIPLNAILTPANDHDVTQLIPLVDGIPPIAGKVGRPQRRPKILQGDRAYDSNAHRAALKERGIIPVIARRRTEHGSGLGVTRWVVERTNAWLHQFRRLRVRFERRADIHEAFLKLGCCLICWRCLKLA